MIISPAEVEIFSDNDTKTKEGTGRVMGFRVWGLGSRV